MLLRCTNLLSALAILASPGLGVEILLSTHEPFYISGNLTLVIEDADNKHGLVWLKLYKNDQTLKSAVLGLGENFSYYDLDLSVRNIYSGGERDLVAVDLRTREIMGSIEAPRPAATENMSSQSSKKSSDFGLMPLLALLVAALMSPRIFLARR